MKSSVAQIRNGLEQRKKMSCGLAPLAYVMNSMMTELHRHKNVGAK